MARIDQAFQRIRTTVGMVRRVQCYTVISPSASSRELGHWHDLNVSHPKLLKMVESFDCRVERSFRRKRTNVHLVDDGGAQWRRLPSFIRPIKQLMINAP